MCGRTSGGRGRTARGLLRKMLPQPPERGCFHWIGQNVPGCSEISRAGDLSPPRRCVLLCREQKKKADSCPGPGFEKLDARLASAHVGSCGIIARLDPKPQEPKAQRGLYLSWAGTLSNTPLFPRKSSRTTAAFRSNIHQSVRLKGHAPVDCGLISERDSSQNDEKEAFIPSPRCHFLLGSFSFMC